MISAMKKILFSLALATSFAAAHAQTNLTIIKYPIGFTTGALNEYIEKTSWRGIGFGYRHFADGNLAVGLDLQFQSFYERKDYATYTDGTASLSGVQYRYSWMLPMTAQAEFVLNEGEDFRPFIGMGLGALYVYRVTDFGLYRITNDPWQFMLKPEIGMSYYLSNGTALLISGEYHVGFETKDMSGQSWIALNVGLILAGD